jgi:hypothetical protein
MRGYISTLNYETIIRTVRPDAKLHPTVLERLALPLAPQTGKEGHYRPEALRNHQDCKSFYEPQPGPGAQPAGPVEPSTLQTAT